MKPILQFLGPLVLAGIGTILLTESCQKPTTEPDLSQSSSFEQLQVKVLNTNCAISGCHASQQDASYKQHQLVLASGVAYQNLVGVAPALTAARTDSLLRVKPYQFLKSLLFHKVANDPVLCGGKTYGNPMPMGREPLSRGQVEFIRQWIQAGAPQQGQVADAALLDDTTRYTTPFEPLAPPAAGTGFQIRTPVFDIKPSFEREIYVRQPIGNSTEIYVNRFHVKMRPSSHHFVADGFQNNNQLPPLGQIRDLRNGDGSYNLGTVLEMQNHVQTFASQTPELDYRFPEGVALQLPANASLDLNSHYVNKSAKAIPGEVYLNLYTVDKARVRQVAKPIYMFYEKISVPPKTRKTITESFTLKKNVNVIMLTSHTHKYGEKFVVRVKGGPRNGEVVYTSTNWEHPEITDFPTPLALKAGEGLTSEVTYYNPTDKTVNFGLSSEDEMNIILGYLIEQN